MSNINPISPLSIVRQNKKHLNVSITSEDTFGKVLHYNYRHTFFIPYLGKFISPTAFSEWLTYGIEDKRWAKKRSKLPIPKWREITLYGKFHQICSLHYLIEEKIKEYEDIPWLMYTKHKTGVIEISNWPEYTNHIRKFINHILDKGTKIKYDWESEFPGLLNYINEKIEVITSRKF